MLHQDPTCPPILLAAIIAIFAIAVLLEDVKIQKKK